MIFVDDKAKGYLISHLNREGLVRKNHQRLLSGLGLKPTFISLALTTFAQKVNQVVVGNQVDEANKKGKMRQKNIYDL